MTKKFITENDQPTYRCTGLGSESNTAKFEDGVVFKISCFVS